jgi:hypothetical protein
MTLEVVQFSDGGCTMTSRALTGWLPSYLRSVIPSLFIPVFIPKTVVLAYSLRGSSSFVAHFFAHYEAQEWVTSLQIPALGGEIYVRHKSVFLSSRSCST